MSSGSKSAIKISDEMTEMSTGSTRNESTDEESDADEAGGLKNAYSVDDLLNALSSDDEPTASDLVTQEDHEKPADSSGDASQTMLDLASHNANDGAGARLNENPDNVVEDDDNVIYNTSAEVREQKKLSQKRKQSVTDGGSDNSSEVDRSSPVRVVSDISGRFQVNGALNTTDGKVDLSSDTSAVGQALPARPTEISSDRVYDDIIDEEDDMAAVTGKIELQQRCIKVL